MYHTLLQEVNHDMNKWNIKVYLGFAMLIALTLSTTNSNLFLQTKANEVMQHAKQSLKEEIEKKAHSYHLEAEDAYIDKVWKKTPGRNGRKVNIPKSYQKMKAEGKYDPSLLVFDKIAPKVSLSDLAPSPIYRGHPNKNMVAMMINVSWGKEYIPEILKVLKKHNVKATFYIEGKWAKENKEFVEMIMEEEHLIGNHAYDHPDMAKISKEEIQMQIDKTNEVLEAITDEKPVWFAPPSGSFNDQVIQIADDMQMETVLWTVDTIDWRNPSVSVMMNRVIDNVHPGATVLMHPTAVVAEGLDSMIVQIQEQGYELGTIESLVSENRR